MDATGIAQVPEFDGFVVGTRNDLVAVGRGPGTAHPIRVVGERSHEPAMEKSTLRKNRSKIH